MIVYKKAKTHKEARLVMEFLRHHDFGAEVKENDDFMSDTYPYQVVGNDEEALGFIERHETIVNVMSGEVKRKATWLKPKKKWDERPKRVRK